MKLLSCLVLIAAASAYASEAETVLWPSGLTEMAAQPDSKAVSLPDGSVSVTTGKKYSWPGVRMDFKKPFDMSAYGRITVSVSNTTDRTRSLNLSVKSAAVQGRSPGGSVTLKPYAAGTLSVTLKNMPWTLDAPLKLEGMNGYPSAAGVSGSFDIKKTVSFHIFYNRDGSESGFSVSRVVVSGEGVRPVVLSAKTFLPFVDAFGQFAHADWPGKVHNEAELKATRAAEEKWLAENKVSPISDADRFGGWLAGPQLEATGSFRTEKVNGKWWLVDPDGYLFFSHGVDCVRVGGESGVTGREKYFAWLPAKNDPAYGKYYWHQKGPAAHGFYSKAENVPYDVFSFAKANMVRKYGGNWSELFVRRAHERIHAWGLNTVANWSDPSVYNARCTPYTVTFGTRGPVIEGSTGWWGKLRDPFAPEFIRNAKASAAAEAKRTGTDPWCIGWFVDNELSWGHDNRDLARAVLKSPARQPAKKAFKAWLEKKYVTAARLNDAWGTSYASWDEFLSATAVPDEKKCGDDLNDLHREVVAQYFRTVRDAIKAVAPNRLYLGARIAWGAPVIYEESARYCDVVSVNIYNRQPVKDLPPTAIDKPMINGEFHFGALDRGMFHTGLVATESQNMRAQYYRDFVNACLDHPRFVGTHWFQWQDQALTGRGDGENYQIGFVTVTDTPYPELVAASREIGAAMYERRYGRLPWYRRFFNWFAK